MNIMLQIILDNLLKLFYIIFGEYCIKNVIMAYSS